MPTIDFPNVPDVPGVPPLPRSPVVTPLVRSVIGAAQGVLWRMFTSESRWGIYDSFGQMLGGDNVAGAIAGALGIGATLSTNSVDYSKETRVSDFPIERGSFAAYNKVEQASTPVVSLALGGSESDRTAFLDAIDAACKSLELYSVVTPEVTYIDYSIERYNYQRRNSRGATLLIVEISLREIRQVSAQYAQSNNGQMGAPKDAGATPMSSAGKVQAQAPTKSALRSLADKLPKIGDTINSFLQGG